MSSSWCARPSPRRTSRICAGWSASTCRAPPWRRRPITCGCVRSKPCPGPAPTRACCPKRTSKGERLHQLVERLSVRLGRGQCAWCRWRRPITGPNACSAGRLRALAQARPCAAAAAAGPHCRRRALSAVAVAPAAAAGSARAKSPTTTGRCACWPARSGWKPAGGTGAPGPALRDYFIARSEEAGLLWVYRERLAARAGGEAEAATGALVPARDLRMSTMRHVPALPAYAELHCLTNFSFQRGASHPGELVERAYELGYAALAITDECSVAGVVRAYAALKDMNLAARNDPFQLILGSEFHFDGFRLVALARNVTGWGNLCEFITAARQHAKKGRVHRRAANAAISACWTDARSCSCRRSARTRSMPRMPMTLQADRGVGQEPVRRPHLARGRIAARARRRAVAGHAAARGRARPACRWWRRATCTCMCARARPLQDVITAVREGKAVTECGLALQANAERHLRPRVRLARHLPGRTAGQHAARWRRAAASAWSPSSYQYPLETVPPGMTPAQALRAVHDRRRAQALSAGRALEGAPAARARAAADRRPASTRCTSSPCTTSCASRASRRSCARAAARPPTRRSATAWASPRSIPTRANLLFERFISKERNEPPDIDVDFEHERREEVIQYIYAQVRPRPRRHRRGGRSATARAAPSATWARRWAFRRRPGRRFRQGALLVRRDGAAGAAPVRAGGGRRRADRRAAAAAMAGTDRDAARAFRGT